MKWIFSSPRVRGSQGIGHQEGHTPRRRGGREIFLVLLWLSVSLKGTVASLNSQAVLTPTFSGQFRSSPVPFLFLVFHIYKNEAERSTPVPSWKESIQPNVGLELGAFWSSSLLYMSAPHHVLRSYLSLSLFPSILLSFFLSLSLSHTSSSYNLTEDIFEGHFNFFSLALAVKWYTSDLLQIRITEVIESVQNKKGPRRQWHPTPVLLPGESHGRRILVGCSPWGH